MPGAAGPSVSCTPSTTPLVNIACREAYLAFGLCAVRCLHVAWRKQRMSIMHSSAPALPCLGLLEHASHSIEMASALTLRISWDCSWMSCPNPGSPPTGILLPVVRVVPVDVRWLLSRASQRPELLAPAIVGHYPLIGLLFSVDWDRVSSASSSRLDVCVLALVLLHLRGQPLTGDSVVVPILAYLRVRSCLPMRALFVVLAFPSALE